MKHQTDLSKAAERSNANIPRHKALMSLGHDQTTQQNAALRVDNGSKITYIIIKDLRPFGNQKAADTYAKGESCVPWKKGVRRVLVSGEKGRKSFAIHEDLFPRS